MKKYLFILVILVAVGAIVFEGNVLQNNFKNTSAISDSADNPPSGQSFLRSIFGSVTLKDSSNTGTTANSNQTNSNLTTVAPINPPATEKNASFSFGIFGDTKEFSSGNPNGNLEKAVAQTKDQNLSAFFVMGDLINSCDGGTKCVQKFNEWKSVMSPILAKTYEVVGNHDRTGGDKADTVWRSEFKLPQNGPSGYEDLVYSFDIGNSHFVVLDSEKPKGNIINSVQRDWLDKDLAATKMAHKFVFYHEPAFQAAQDAEDGLDAQPAERDALWNIIKKYKVDAVFNGHAHIYARKTDGVEQIVVGDTDSTNDDIVQPGLSDFGYKGKSYAIVTVTGKNINLKLFTVDGKQIESFDFT